METQTPQPKKQEKEINDYILKIIGSSSLPQPLNTDKDYTFLIKAEIDTESKKDLKDGKIDIIYKYRQIEATIVDEKQNMIFSKDRRSRSQRLRGRIYIWQKDNGIPMDDEAYYNMMLDKIITYFPLVAEFLKGKH